MGYDGCALLVQPSRIPNRNSHWTYFMQILSNYNTKSLYHIENSVIKGTKKLYFSFLYMWNQYRWYLASIWKIEKTSPDGAVIQKYQKQMLKWGYLHYWSTPRDPKGSKRTVMIHLTCFWRFGALRLTPIWRKFEKPSKNRHFWWVFFNFDGFFLVCSVLGQF